MMAMEDGTLAAHWLAKTGPDTYAYGIYISLSLDGGATWSDPVIPHRDGTPAEHGFVSFVPHSRDRIGITWLDGREMAGSEHGHGGGGAMTLRYASIDRDGNLGDEALLDSKVCDCCQTDAVRTKDGSIVVAYRDRSDEEIRDMSVVRRENGGWSPPSPIHEDGWKINGCPVNGPALDSRRGMTVAAWFTVDAQDTAHVRVAFSNDGGRTFDPPVRVDDGNPHGRVDVALLKNGSALVTWLEQADSTRAEIRVRRVTVDGRIGPSTAVAETSPSRASGFPRMAVWKDEVFLAWTEVGEPSQVRTAVYR
jgi:hypothetical protein